MKPYMIENVIGREILDSRGIPTVEAQIVLQDGTTARASVPSGASTGEFEALELRDQDAGRYLGKGVMKAVHHINHEIKEAIKGMDVSDIYAIDAAMLALDGSEDKIHLGANAILAVSLACAKTAAKAYHLPLYRFIGGINANRMPLPMMNILNGGARQYCRYSGVYDHADRRIRFSGRTALVCGSLSNSESDLEKRRTHYRCR